MPINPNSLANLSKPGTTNNPGGKPVAARNALSRALIEALRNDFDQHGAKAIQAVRKNDPSTYLRVIASIVPKEMTINEGESAIERILDSIDDEQLTEFVEGLRLITAVAKGGKAADQAQAGSQPTGVH